MTTRALSRSRARPRGPDLATADVDETIAAAERDAVVIWRGERIPLRALPGRIAETDGRAERDGLYAGWIEALEAINPHYRARLAVWRERASSANADDPAVALAGGRELEPFAIELERFVIASETVYYAALRRYLALIDIEQGDGTIADLWHVERGPAWSHWFSEREVARAAELAGRDTTGAPAPADWSSAASAMTGTEAAEVGTGAAVIGELYGSLVGDPAWLERALRMAGDEVAAFADFAAFIRLWRLRHAVGVVQYELRLYRTDDEAIQRAYYSGIVGHMTGISVPEAAYLRDVGTPFAAAARLEQSMAAGAAAERLETRFGSTWWSDPAARDVVAQLRDAASSRDVLAQLGYDAPDWRPVLRQIRTRLIGEMSGYGGPNITTRAGTRKV